jgi:hypothetical protein
MIMLDASPIAGGVGLAAAAVFFVAFVVAAFVVFKLLRKTVKMAFRVAIVGVILLIAIVGSISFWWLGSGKNTHPERPRSTQTK